MGSALFIGRLPVLFAGAVGGWCWAFCAEKFAAQTIRE
jgi:hypothetical protein